MFNANFYRHSKLVENKPSKYIRLDISDIIFDISTYLLQAYTSNSAHHYVLHLQGACSSRFFLYILLPFMV